MRQIYDELLPQIVVSFIMAYLICILFASISTDSIVLFQHTIPQNIGEWYILDDRVMGGRSKGKFEFSTEKVLKYFGLVSTENYGGFSSIRYRFNQIKLTSQKKIHLRIKGDGKSYQFRLKASSFDPHSYVTSFQTSGEWETIILDITDFYPSYRGRQLDMPNFNQESLEEISILIGNKMNESFEIQVKEIILL